MQLAVGGLLLVLICETTKKEEYMELKVIAKSIFLKFNG